MDRIYLSIKAAHFLALNAWINESKEAFRLSRPMKDFVLMQVRMGGLVLKPPS